MWENTETMLTLRHDHALTEEGQGLTRGVPLGIKNSELRNHLVSDQQQGTLLLSLDPTVVNMVLNVRRNHKVY